MNEPLPYRMRPTTIDDVVGQEHLLGKNMLLYKLITNDNISSMLLYGTPGTGKTTIAEIIEKNTKYKFYKLNAVTAGVSDIKEIVDETQNMLFNPLGKSIVFIDEIHRFNKKQQDILLPYVESGLIILIGATTENPYFEINKALLSRLNIFKLNSLTNENIVQILHNAIKKDKYLKELNISITDDILQKLANISNGDVRFALSSLENVIMSTPLNENAEIKITDDILSNIFKEKKHLFDKNGNEHYDNISAMIKSIRGSDPNAAIVYMAKILNAGEDPMFVARRLVISAAEDIGLANPQALILATSGLEAVKNIGMPESRIILAEVVIYLANSKKSNTAYTAINRALEDIKHVDIGEIPYYLKNNYIKQENEKEGYIYPHDKEKMCNLQSYMPINITDRKYYLDKFNRDDNTYFINRD